MGTTISQAEKKKLKGMAHHLKPVIHVGKGGLTDGVIKSVNDALDAHELIKVQFLDAAVLDRKKDSKRLASLVHADLVQVIGFKISLYRHNPEKKKHVLE